MSERPPDRTEVLWPCRGGSSSSSSSNGSATISPEASRRVGDGGLPTACGAQPTPDAVFSRRTRPTPDTGDWISSSNLFHPSSTFVHRGDGSRERPARDAMAPLLCASAAISGASEGGGRGGVRAGAAAADGRDGEDDADASRTSAPAEYLQQPAKLRGNARTTTQSSQIVTQENVSTDDQDTGNLQDFKASTDCEEDVDCTSKDATHQLGHKIVQDDNSTDDQDTSSLHRFQAGACGGGRAGAAAADGRDSEDNSNASRTPAPAYYLQQSAELRGNERATKQSSQTITQETDSTDDQDTGNLQDFKASTDGEEDVDCTSKDATHRSGQKIVQDNVSTDD